MNHLRLTDRDPLERRVATWMAHEEPASAAASDPEIDRILFATSRLRPDPRWLSLLKESPMRTTTDAGPRIAVGSPARVFVLAILLVSLIAAIGVAVVASGILKPVVIPAPPLSALTWRQPVAGGSFLPLATIARDPQGRIWVSDAGSQRFAIHASDGTFIEYWRPSDGPPVDLRRENGDAYGAIAFAPDGSRFILDVGNHRVVAYDATGAFVTAWGEEGFFAGQFTDPVGIAVRADGSVSVLDDDRGVIESYSRDGTVLTSVDIFPAWPAGLEKSSNGFASDAAGNLYVSQVMTSVSGRVQKFSPTGERLQVFGESDPGMFKEQPTQIAVDAAGYLYVTQGAFRNDRPGVLIFHPDGTYVGGFGPIGADEGELGFPTGILVDDLGNLVVVDSGMPLGDGFTGPSLQGYKISLPTTQ